MKKLIFTLLAAILLAACSQTGNRKSAGEARETSMEQTVSQGEALLNILNANGQSLVVLNHDSLSYYHGRGVSDLLYLVSNEPDRLRGAIVADKMIGKAAAILMVTGGVNEAYTNLICTPAVEVFRAAGVPVYAREEVPQILNRDRSAQCPIDALLNQTDQIEECVAILKARFEQ